jgi:hypothetical protein
MAEDVGGGEQARVQRPKIHRRQNLDEVIAAAAADGAGLAGLSARSQPRADVWER